MTAEVPEDATELSARRSRALDRPDDATEVSVRRATTADAVDDVTAVSIRRRTGSAADVAPDDTTAPSIRSRTAAPGGDDVVDATLLAVRRRTQAMPHVDDATVPVRRDDGAALAPPTGDETVVRPVAPARTVGPAPFDDMAPTGVAARSARIPDPEALPERTRPRAIPATAATRAKATVRPDPLASVPQHDTTERLARTAARRRALVVVLSAAAVAIASAGALVLLLN